MDDIDIEESSFGDGTYVIHVSRLFDSEEEARKVGAFVQGALNAFDNDREAELLVCAALKHNETGRVIAGARHYDEIMRHQIEAAEGIEHWKSHCTQGFITNKFGRFVDRKEGMELAMKQGQVRYVVSGSSSSLFSENLY